MGRGLHTVLVRALLRHAGVGSPCGRDPRLSRSSRIPPPPASRALLGGGRPLGPGGAKGRSCGSQAGGGCRGGGVGGVPSRPPAPSGVGLPAVVSGVPPPGYTRAIGVAGRLRASGAVRSAADGSVRRGGGGGGGNPPALVRAPVFPGPASDKAAPFAPSWVPPVRRRPVAGRACGRLPRPRCPRTPGAAASSGGVRGRRFCGLPPSTLQPEWEGGGEWGGPSGPLAPPPDGQGGGCMAVPARRARHRLGGRTLPPPPFT